MDRSGNNHSKERYADSEKQPLLVFSFVNASLESSDMYVSYGIHIEIKNVVKAMGGFRGE